MTLNKLNLKKLALKVGLAGLMVAGGAAAVSAAEAQATSGVNVRTGPGTQYGVVDQLRAGEWVDILGCQGSWCRIEHSGPDGWVSANYLSRGGRDYYDDDYGRGPPVVVVRPPRYYEPYRPRPRYWGGYPSYPRQPYANFCVGGNNASFCIGN